jgi:hypothetical protein
MFAVRTSSFAITGAVMMADSPPGIAFEDIP